MQLIYYPDPILLKVCVKCPHQSEQEKTSLAEKMWKIMNDNNGVGLAAPQVGLNIRMFVWKNNGHNMAIWNPSLSHLSGEIQIREGCLSLPKIIVTTKRSINITMTGTDIRGIIADNNPVSNGILIFGDSSVTPIWQHEVDHLDGKLIIDNMNRSDTKTNRDILRTLLKTL